MPSFLQPSRVLLQPLKTTWLSAVKAEAAMLRLDLLHPQVSGNKWFKLKYNLQAAHREGKNTILTFGGARSNHIAATATACRLMGLKSIGLIRGDFSDNPTLSHAKAEGMCLHFISREQYRHKEDVAFLRQLQHRFPEAFLIPEGGNNDLGMQGAREILQIHDTKPFTHICCPVGTGTTLAGLITEAETMQEVLGFSALKKADTQRLAIKNFIGKYPDHSRWKIVTDYHFGGFARKTEMLSDFMKTFSRQQDIPLDFVYTAKMLFGIKDRLEKGLFPAGSNLLIIHTGGLQGNKS